MKEMHIDSRLLESVDGKYSIMSEGPSCAGNWYRRSCKRKTEDSQAWKSFQEYCLETFREHL